MFKKLLLIGLSVGVLSACAALEKKEAGAQQDVSAKKKGIRLDVKADKRLNFFNNQSHTLVLVIYQMNEPNYFEQLAMTPEGIGDLLEAKPNDASIVSRRKLLVQPGENKQVYIDRSKAGNYIGVLAGYFSDDVRGVSRMLNTDIREHNMFFWRPSDGDPADTLIGLSLGAEKITGIVINGNSEGKVM